MKITTEIDRIFIRKTGGSRRHALIHIEAPSLKAEKGRAPLNLSIVIDRSGSMSGPKLECACQAAIRTVQTLTDTDRFSIISYDNRIKVVVPSTPATATARSEAEQKIARLQTGGSTDLCGGWLKGCREIANHLQDEQLGRCLLLTDGLANQGVTDPQEIIGHARELQQRFVSTSTFGIGDHFDEQLLKSMAEAGGGNFYYIENANQIPEFIASELQENLEVIARDAEIIIEAPAGIRIESVNDYPIRTEGNQWKVSLGSLVTRQALSATIRITFPEGIDGNSIILPVTLQDRDGALQDLSSTLQYHYADDQTNNAQPRNTLVDLAVAKLYAARVKQEALMLNRDGKYDQAGELLHGCIKKIRGYAFNNLDILDVINDLERNVRRYTQPMAVSLRKSCFLSEVAYLKSRHADGKSRRHDSL